MSEDNSNNLFDFRNDDYESHNDTTYTIGDKHERNDSGRKFPENNDNGSNLYDGNSNCEVKRHPSVGFSEIYDACLVCSSKIYPMEKLNVDGKLYHKNCFRCSKCRTILSVTNFTLNNNLIYCKTHFMELFKLRGKFDDDENIQHEIVTGTETETIPTIDTKGLLEKFRKLESGGGATPQPSSVTRRDSHRYVQASDDVVKCDDLAPDELPPPETAKAMVAKFKAMESDKNVPSPVCVEKMKLKAKANLTPNANVRLQTGSIQACANEDDYNKEELPEEGTTKNLLQKFQNFSESN